MGGELGIRQRAGIAAEGGQHVEPVRKRGRERGVGRGLDGRKGGGHV